MSENLPAKIDIGSEVLLADEELRRIMKDNSVSRQAKTKRKLKHLDKTYGHLQKCPAPALPPEHKAAAKGALRCFALISKRDSAGNKIKGTLHRCGNIACNGSFYCRQHRGGNKHNLTTGNSQNPILAKYRDTVNNSMGHWLEAFINDETIFDLKPELATLRAVLAGHIEKLANAKPVSPNKFVKYMQKIVDSEDITPLEKFKYAKEMCDNYATLTDPDSVDRIARTVEVMSRVIERLNKAQNSDDFMLTPDGLKIFLRAVVDVISEKVTDENVKEQIKEAFYEINMQTGGDLSRYASGNTVDAEFTVEN